MNFTPFLMGLSFIFTTFFVNNAFNQQIRDDMIISARQSQRINVIKETLKVYFNDKRTVTVLWLKDENNELLNAIVNDTSLESLFMHFDNLKLLKQLQGKKSFSPLIAFSTSEGYLVYENLEALVKRNILKLLYEINPRARIVFLLDAATDTDIFWFLEWSWREFKFINTVTMNIHEGENEINLFAYNPFKTTEKVAVFNLTSVNVASEAKKMWAFNREKIWNLHQYPLKVFLFEQQMSCIKLSDTRYGYQDGELVHLLADRMNFTPQYVTDANGITYGIETDDGHFTGSLGAVEDNKVDIAGNVRIITNGYRTRNLLFLRPTSSTKLVYMVPKNYLKKSFVIFPLGFYTIQVVMLYIVAFMSFSLVFYGIKYCSARKKTCNDERKAKEDADLAKIVLTMIGIHHSISVSSMDFNTIKKRLVVGTAFLYSVVLSSMYQGNIVKELNSLNDKNDIRTFEQLLSSPLQLLIHADLAVHIEFFKDFAPQSIFNQIYKRNSIIPNSIADPTDFIAYNRSAALLTLELYATMLKINYFDQNEGEERVEVLPMSLKETFNSITVPKTSPFIDEINYWLARFDQAGLISHQIAVAESDLKLKYIQYAKLGGNPNLKLRILTFTELNSLFLFMLVFHLCAFVTLVCEIIWSKRHDLFRCTVHQIE